MDLLGMAQQLINSGVGQNPGMNNNMFGMLIRMLQFYPGGLPGLVQELEQSGLGEQVQSWVSPGQNQPVSPAQIQQALAPHVQQIAQQANVPPQDVANAVAALLPQLIDKLTPHGTVPDNHAAVNSALEELKSKLAA